MHTLAWFAQPQLGAGSSASHLLQHEELSKLRRQAEANGGAGDTSEVLRELAAELMLVAISVFEKMPPPFRDALKRQDSANYQPEHVLEVLIHLLPQLGAAAVRAAQPFTPSRTAVQPYAEHDCYVCSGADLDSTQFPNTPPPHHPQPQPVPRPQQPMYRQDILGTGSQVFGSDSIAETSRHLSVPFEPYSHAPWKQQQEGGGGVHHPDETGPVDRDDREIRSRHYADTAVLRESRGVLASDKSVRFDPADESVRFDVARHEHMSHRPNRDSPGHTDPYSARVKHAEPAHLPPPREAPTKQSALAQAEVAAAAANLELQAARLRAMQGAQDSSRPEIPLMGQGMHTSPMHSHADTSFREQVVSPGLASSLNASVGLGVGELQGLYSARAATRTCSSPLVRVACSYALCPLPSKRRQPSGKPL
jgi:hypothetical protein